MDELMTGQEEPKAESSKLSKGQKLFYAFTRPRQLFSSLAEKPDLLFPMLTVVIVSVLLILSLLPNLKEAILAVTQIQALPAAQAGMAVTVGISKTTARILLLPPLLIVIEGAVFNFFANLLGGEGNFKRAMSVVAYSSFIGLLGGIVKTGIMWAVPADRMQQVQTSLAVALPPDQATTPLYQLLAHFDLFTLWSLVFIGIGISVTHRISSRKSTVMVFALWGIYVAVSMAFFVFVKSKMPA